MQNKIPIDIWANRTFIHYQHWSIISLINILITPFETSYALWLAKTDLFTVMPILRYYQRKCVFIVGKKNNDSCQNHPPVIRSNHSNKCKRHNLSLPLWATHVLSLQFPNEVCNYCVSSSLSPQIHVKFCNPLQYQLVCIRVNVYEKQNYLVQYRKCDYTHEDS